MQRVMVYVDGYRFSVKVGKPEDAEAVKAGTKPSRGANFRCLMSGAPMQGGYVKAEGKAGRMGARFMAIVAEGDRGRVYLAPAPEHETAAWLAKPEWHPEVTISGSTQYLGVKRYGMTKFRDMFAPRQLVALTTFSDLVGEAREHVRQDALSAGFPENANTPHDGGADATTYAKVVGVYLAFAVDRLSRHIPGFQSPSTTPSNNRKRKGMAEQSAPAGKRFWTPLSSPDFPSPALARCAPS